MIKLSLEGTFRVRGESIDIFPAESDHDAIRIELFDDEVENISIFDPLTGAISEKGIRRCTIYPKTHYVTPREKLLDAIEHIKVELVDRKKVLLENHKLIEEQRIASVLNLILK